MTNRLLDSLSRRMTAPQATGAIAPATRGSVMPALPRDYLKGILDAMDAAPERRRLGDGAGEFGHYTHVSSLIDICMRQQALASLDSTTYQDTVTGGHRVMWAFGRAVEKHIRTQFLKATRNAMAFGRWVCPCETSEHVGHFPAQMVCSRCGHALSDYREYTLYDHDNWIKGNPDLLVALPGNWMVPIEIKSMSKKQFDKLEQPKGDHVFQVGNYHRMGGLEGFRMHREAIIIYCVKEFDFGSPYKEFHVDTEAQYVKNVVADAARIAGGIRLARETGQIPERTLCSTHTTTRAKKCPCVVRCFSMR